jgi:hypothetical protein
MQEQQEALLRSDHVQQCMTMWQAVLYLSGTITSIMQHTQMYFEPCTYRLVLLHLCTVHCC